MEGIREAKYEDNQEEMQKQQKDALWQLYWQTGKNLEVRNQLAMSYAYIVKLYAYQMWNVYKKYADLEDMVNQGMLILLEAVEKYDPEKKAKFESYASLRVKGAIIDFVRNQDWISKRSKKEARLINEATDILTIQLNRIPTVEEIGAYLNLPVATIEKSLSEMQMFHVLSYEELVDIGLYGVRGYQDEGIRETEQPSGKIEEHELQQVIANSLEQLTEKERLVVTLYYYEELKKKDIAYILDVSASRVCQIHNSALKKMRYFLNDYLFGDDEID